MVFIAVVSLSKVWDVADGSPKCVQERDMKMGRLHCAEGCPDAPFVVCAGGDKASENLRILDVRESPAGAQTDFGQMRMADVC